MCSSHLALLSGYQQVSECLQPYCSPWNLYAHCILPREDQFRVSSGFSLEAFYCHTLRKIQLLLFRTDSICRYESCTKLNWTDFLFLLYSILSYKFDFPKLQARPCYSPHSLSSIASYCLQDQIYNSLAFKIFCNLACCTSPAFLRFNRFPGLLATPQGVDYLPTPHIFWLFSAVFLSASSGFPGFFQVQLKITPAKNLSLMPLNGSDFLYLQFVPYVHVCCLYTSVLTLVSLISL